MTEIIHSSDYYIVTSASRVGGAKTLTFITRIEG